MISLTTFTELVRDRLGRDLNANVSQNAAVRHDTEEILLLVAGPGSGKTTVLVLRALRHVLVDDVLPDEILITTFTRKAARELRTRWLDWGTALVEALGTDPTLRPALARIDLNRCRIDTLDSLAEQALSDCRLPGEIAPIIAEKASAKLMLKRWTFTPIYDANKAILDPFFLKYGFSWQKYLNKGEALSIAQTLCDRLAQDRVNLDLYAANGAAERQVAIIFNSHSNELANRGILDFALLEQRFLERLTNGQLGDWVNSIRIVLIDEYQDTNPLQESIYFELIRAVQPSVTVVGDDDQAMYRFRGGSVELFTAFSARCNAETGRVTRRIDMVTNYRSSEEIVEFYNSHILGDPGFSAARITPSKPEVIAARGPIQMPVLGLFAQDPEILAENLANWLNSLFTNRVATIHSGLGDVNLTLPVEGDLGDCVFLSHSTEEIKYDSYKSAAKPRFLHHVREAMISRHCAIFNPRGRKLRTIESVQQLLGLLLICIDPNGALWQKMYPTGEVRFFLAQWQASANAFVHSNPHPNAAGGIGAYVRRWQNTSLGIPDPDFPDEWPILRLLFKLMAWMPQFQSDPEHQVWLEAITRAITSAGMASAYGMQILKNGVHGARSRESFLRDALFALAENDIEVDEEIMPSVPRNMLQLMTIHQAKGLEFPLVIVDVGSHFGGIWQRQAFLRFPRELSNVVVMEDDVEDSLPMPLRGGRRPEDRSFDDLTRLYYVAFSRPQSVLLLVGHEKCLKYGTGADLKGAIPNIALGWRRDGTWPWRQEYPGRRPPIEVEPPFTRI